MEINEYLKNYQNFQNVINTPNANDFTTSSNKETVTEMVPNDNGPNQMVCSSLSIGFPSPADE